ncbi:MAG: aminoacyl--tRNA ligase-related protein [Halobacterium sp.]
MRRSELFLPASRETPGAGTDATKRLVRAGLIRGFGSGLWGFTPVGQRVRGKLVDSVTAAMDGVGGQRVHLPGLQYRERWQESGRWASFEGEMFTFRNRDGQDVCLAPSHEEGMVHLVDGRVRSHDDLPLLLYQVASKFRDDHARNGLVRTKEFTMKDAYSFHVDRASLRETYRAVSDAYERVLADVGLEFAVVSAEDSVMGGAASEEFVAPVESGSDRLVHCTADGCRFGVTDEHGGFDAHDAGGDCPDCGSELAESDGIEVGHVFDLDTRYSAAMDLTVDTADGGERAVLMGSYGLGVDRLLQTLVQQHAGFDADGGVEGCAWPVTDWGSVAPYRAAVVPVGGGDARAVAEDVYDAAGREDVLFYDDLAVGERFAEADLLGIPAKVVVGNTYRERGVVDVETAAGTEQLAPGDVPEKLAAFAAGETD